MVQTEIAIEFYPDRYNEKITESVSSFDFEPWNTVTANTITVKETKYKNNMFVLIARNEDGLVFGKIKMILLQGESDVYFVTERYQSSPLVDLEIYCLNEINSSFECIAQNNLLDYYPLPDYKVCGLSVIALHHSFPSL